MPAVRAWHVAGLAVLQVYSYKVSCLVPADMQRHRKTSAAQLGSS